MHVLTISAIHNEDVSARSNSVSLDMEATQEILCKFIFTSIVE